MAECAFENVKEIADKILSQTKRRPKLAIVCGSGLGTLVDAVEDNEVFPYSSIPQFPKSTVQGHAGNLVFGTISGKDVVLMQGRFHPYEGYTTQQCTLPIRVLHLVGVTTLFLTNAAGGINQSFKVGDIMVIKDHISMPALCGLSPLCGPNDERFGARFIALSDAYDRKLQALAHTVAKAQGLGPIMHTGVYMNQLGPCYETVAECVMINRLGGEVVGMSTAHEVIVAKHVGLRVFAMSLVTNMAILDYETHEKANHMEVMEMSAKRANEMRGIVKGMIEEMDDI